jgi:NAD(P)H-hydrate repair Nnr-like enzyme with NAD(P)H-hydrate dehydratase domain
LPPFSHQTDAPLFPKVLYNRPVTRGGAGRLLIPGGHTGELSQPTALYELAMAAGAGECVVALPDAVVKFLGGAPATTFVASSPSGSLGREALGRLLELSEDVDAVALGASLSNNSQTSILLEGLLREVERPVIAFDDAIRLTLSDPANLIDRPDNLLVVTMPEVFKLADRLGVPISVRPRGGLANKLEIVAVVSEKIAAGMMIYGTEIIAVTPGDEPVVTPVDYRLSTYPSVYHAVASVFWLQNRASRRAGLATAAYVIGRVSHKVRHETKQTVAQLAALIRTEVDAGDF